MSMTKSGHKSQSARCVIYYFGGHLSDKNSSMDLNNPVIMRLRVKNTCENSSIVCIFSFTTRSLEVSPE